MCNTLAGRHETGISPLDDLHGAGTFKVFDFTFQQIGHCRKPDLWMLICIQYHFVGYCVIANSLGDKTAWEVNTYE